MAPGNSSPGDNLRLSAAEKRLLDQPSVSNREGMLQDLQVHLDGVADIPELQAERAGILLQIAGLLLDLDRSSDAVVIVRDLVEVFINNQQFEDAALACQYIYLAGDDDAIPAIGQAAWLAVTYPVDPALSANILDHIIDETPDDSDGAAVAAATAHFVVDIRSTGKQHEELQLFTGGMLARVARRHSNIESQTAFADWVKRLELDAPEKFLGRMRNVIDVMVQDEWQFDRDQLQAALPADEDS